MANVTDALDRHARERPGDLAAHDGQRALTWSDLRERVDAAAAILRSAGVAVGHRVALIAPDGIDALVAALAILRLGAVHAPIDHTLAPPEVTAAETAMGTAWRVRIVEPASGGGERVYDIVATGAPVEDPLGPGVSAFLRLSSGTTGTAKGVLLSHATIVERIAAANAGLGIAATDRVLWLLPMAYHFAVSVLLYLDRGAAIVFGNRLRAAQTAEVARKARCTVIYASPWHIRRLAELPPGADLPTGLRLVVSTTTALDAGAAPAFHARHGLHVRQGLGIIEIGLPFLSPGGVGEQPGDLGPAQPAYRVHIRDSAGNDLPPGQPGELAISGPGLLDAYLTPWRSRAAILRAGAFHTGDLAEVTPVGGVRLLGRLKDVINVGGVKVFPLDIEAVLAAHPQVAACRVRGQPDDRLGEQVAAEVQPAPDATADLAEQLAAWCADRLAPLKRPARITIVALLPMTASGKVRR